MTVRQRGARGKGKVYLVGAGPGDPGLLTLRGKSCLESAEVIVYDYLANPRLLRLAPPDAVRISCGKHGGVPGLLKQDEINAYIIEHAREGHHVVRLKGGDPFLFGRGGEEGEALVAAGIPFEVVPGVSSAIAAPAYAGIPLTHRDYASTVTFVSGTGACDRDPPDIPWSTVEQGGTLVLLMSVTRLGANLARLREHGIPATTPAALVRWGSVPTQITVVGTVGDLAERAQAMRIRPPAVVVVGAVVRLRETLRWFETLPLFGRSIVVTRARHQASEFVERLEALGAEVLEVPAIEIVPPKSYEPLDAALLRLAEYDWVIFTSVNGVRTFLERLSMVGGDTRRLGRARLAAIGSETARALERAYLRADVVPPEFRAEALPAALGEEAVRGRRILLPRAAGARAVLPLQLRRMGAEVDDVATYQTAAPSVNVDDLRHRLAGGQVNMLTFASSSTARHFVQLVGSGEVRAAVRRRAADGHRVRVACIGPITAATATELGLPVDVQPPQYTIAAFTEAIAAHFSDEG